MALSQVFAFLKPAPITKPITDPTQVNEDYQYWRTRTFYSIYAGYFFYYFTRKSLTFVAPYLKEAEGLTKDHIGILMSILAVAYGVSKFTSGILCDRSNPRYFMAVGIIFTGICNICFGLSSSIFFLALWWGLNGWFQGWGWPACTKQLTHWFGRRERGTWWSVCTTSHNFGGFVVTFLAIYCSKWYGWRYGMIIPGIICIIVGFWLINRLRDVPQSLGLPKIEVFKNEINEVNEASEIEESNTNTKTNKYTNDSESLLTPRQILFENVLNNKFVWILGLSYFFVYVVRTAINDWGVFYLEEEKGFAREIAAYAVAAFEIGGVFGMLSAGFCSDYFFRGKRVPVMVLCSIGLLAALIGLWFLGGNQQWSAALLMALVGFLVFGPQMLVGLAAAEFVTKKAASTSNGFVGCFGYLGAAIAGYPLGKLSGQVGWHAFMITLAICAFLAITVLLPIWSIRSEGRYEKADDRDSKLLEPKPKLV